MKRPWNLAVVAFATNTVYRNKITHTTTTLRSAAKEQIAEKTKMKKADAGKDTLRSVAKEEIVEKAKTQKEDAGKDDGADNNTSAAPSFNIDDPAEPIVSSYTSNEASESSFVRYTDDGRCVPAGPVGQVKERLGNFLTQPRVEVVVCALVLLNSLLVAVSTLQNLSSDTYQTLRYSEEVIGIVLAIEFLGRWFSSTKQMGRYVLDPGFAVDTIAVLLPVVFGSAPRSFWINTPFPDWLTSQSGLFNLRLLRVFRLSRVIESKETFQRFEEALNIPLADDVQDWQLQLARVLLSLFTLLSVASGLIYTAEHDVNPNIPDYFTALYFGLTSLTTVGFGDIYPVTAGGRFVVCGSIVAGVAVVPAQAAALVEALLARQKSRKTKKKRILEVPSEAKAMNSFSNKELNISMECANCGSTLHWTDARFCYYCGEDL